MLKGALGGAFAPSMPAIDIGDNHAEALYAYLVNTAWSAYEKTNEHPQGDAH